MNQKKKKKKKIGGLGDVFKDEWSFILLNGDITFSHRRTFSSRLVGGVKKWENRK